MFIILFGNNANYKLKKSIYTMGPVLYFYGYNYMQLPKYTQSIKKILVWPKLNRLKANKARITNSYPVVFKKLLGKHTHWIENLHIWNRLINRCNDLISYTQWNKGQSGRINSLIFYTLIHLVLSFSSHNNLCSVFFNKHHVTYINNIYCYFTNLFI